MVVVVADYGKMDSRLRGNDERLRAGVTNGGVAGMTDWLASSE
jgi:hypothetical protein